MDAKFGPDGSLYLLEWGSGFGRDNTDSGLYRIDYRSGDRSPVVKAGATPSTGGVPLTVRFSSAGTYDPEGGRLGYRWTFGDGGTSTAANPEHTYTARGNYNAQLTVTDPTGKTGVANVSVAVGNTAPTVTFTAPAHGGMFGWGDRVPYSVSVTDPEDGTIDCNRVTTTPALGHDEHAHPITSITGCTGVLNPQTDSAHAEGNSFYVADATYTDNGVSGGTGLTGRAQVLLQPKHKQAEFFTGSSGVRVVSQPDAEADGRIGDISNNDWVSYRTYNFTGIDQVSFRVSSPSGGGTIELRAGSPTGALIASAPVGSTGGWDNYVSQPAVTVTRPSGTIELFMVFKSSTNNSFDVDSMTFIGPGVASGGTGAGKQITGIGGKCVTPYQGSSTDGTAVQLWPCAAHPYQKWTVEGSTIRTLGKCIDLNGTSAGDGTAVQLRTCNGAATQNWSVQPDGTIRNGGKCLDAYGASSADGTALITWTCHGGSNQRWTLS